MQTERMQTMNKIQKAKMSKYQAGMNMHAFKTLTQEFEQQVTNDQAQSVFLTANARLLAKAKTLN